MHIGITGSGPVAHRSSDPCKITATSSIIRLCSDGFFHESSKKQILAMIHGRSKLTDCGSDEYRCLLSLLSMAITEKLKKPIDEIDGDQLNWAMRLYIRFVRQRLNSPSGDKQCDAFELYECFKYSSVHSTYGQSPHKFSTEIHVTALDMIVDILDSKIEQSHLANALPYIANHPGLSEDQQKKALEAVLNFIPFGSPNSYLVSLFVVFEDIFESVHDLAVDKLFDDAQNAELDINERKLVVERFPFIEPYLTVPSYITKKCYRILVELLSDRTEDEKLRRCAAKKLSQWIWDEEDPDIKGQTISLLFDRMADFSENDKLLDKIGRTLFIWIQDNPTSTLLSQRLNAMLESGDTPLRLKEKLKRYIPQKSEVIPT